MKKVLALLACSLLLLSGCSDASASISNGSEAVVTINGKSLSKQDLYSFMSNYGGSYYAITNAQKTILDSEVEVTEEMTNNVESTLEVYSSMLGDGFESYLQQQGFASIDDYREVLVQNEQLTQLNAKYVEANYDSLATQYTPRKIQIMQFSDEATAISAQEAVLNGEDFATVASSMSSTMDGASQIVTSQSSFETAVQYAISTQTVGAVGDVIANDDGSSYYLLLINSSDPAEIKEEAIPVIAAISTISDTSLEYYFKEYNFTIYDIDLYNQISQNYSNLLNQ